MNILGWTADRPQLIPPSAGESGAWTLASDWRCEVRTDYGLLAFRLSEGFVTDLASIPSVVRWFVDKDAFVPAALVHDALYASQFLSKELADFLLGEMAASYVGRLKAAVVRMAVQGFGEAAYDDRTAQDEANAGLVSVEWSPT